MASSHHHALKLGEIREHGGVFIIIGLALALTALLFLTRPLIPPTNLSNQLKTLAIGGYEFPNLENVGPVGYGGWWPDMMANLYDINNIDNNPQEISNFVADAVTATACAAQGDFISSNWLYNITTACSQKFACDPYKQLACSVTAVRQLMMINGYDPDNFISVCGERAALVKRIIPALNWHGATVSVDTIGIYPTYFKKPDGNYGVAGHALNTVTITPNSGPHAGKTYEYSYDMGWSPGSFYARNQTAYGISPLPQPGELPPECRPPEVYLKLRSYPGQEWGSPAESPINFVIAVVDKLGSSIPAPHGILAGFRTTDGTAYSPNDYASRYETFPIEAGQSSYIVNVNVNDDLIVEPTESMHGRILDSSAGAKPLTNAIIWKAQGYSDQQIVFLSAQRRQEPHTAYGLIFDNDSAPSPTPTPTNTSTPTSSPQPSTSPTPTPTPSPTPASSNSLSFSTVSSTAYEGGSAARFTLSCSGPCGSVNVTARDNSTSDCGSPDIYEYFSYPVYISSGSSTSITVSAKTDACTIYSEGSESFSVSASVNGASASATGYVAAN